MFYKEDDIKSIIICPACKIKYEDPRVLECGCSMCFTCISSFIIKEKNGINCPVCHNFHETPKNGFIKNNQLADLTIKTPNNVYRGRQTEDFKKTLDEILKRLNDLDQDIKLGHDNVKKYCLNLKSEVQLATELKIKEINELNKELIDEINQYEEECEKKFITEENVRQELDKFTADMHSFYAKWTAYLSEYNLDESEIENAFKQAKINLKEIGNEKFELENRLYNFIKPRFEKNSSRIDKSFIGLVKTEKLNPSIHSVLKKIKSINLKDKPSNYQPGRLIRLKYFSNGKILFAFSDFKNSFAIVSVLDSQGNVLKQSNRTITKANPLSTITIQNIKIDFFEIIIYLCVSYFTDLTVSRVLISKLDESLNSLSETAIDNYRNISVSYFNGELFCFSVHQNSQNNAFIFVYNKDLSSVKKIGQNNQALPFYIPATISKLDVNDTYFIYLNNKEIKLMNKTDGLVSKSFSINANDFSLYFEKTLLAYESNLSILNVYGIDGNKTEIKCEDNIPKGFELLDCSNENLLFFDSNNLVIKL
jgi:hypothetical protein